jgi:hypothetical protein
MKNEIINIIYQTPQSFQSSLLTKNIKYSFLNSINFQSEVRKFSGYENFEVSRNDNDVIGKVIKQDNEYNIFFNNKFVNNDTIKHFCIKQLILHELSHVVFYDFSNKFDLKYKKEVSISSILNNILVDLIDEYYAERKSLEIIKSSLQPTDIDYFLKKYVINFEFSNIAEFKYYINFLSVKHSFKKRIIFGEKKNIKIFSNKINEMYKNENFDLTEIFDMCVDVIDDNQPLKNILL